MTQRKIQNGTRCPYEYGLKVLSGKWQARILTAIFFYGSLRYSALKVHLRPISDTVLTAMLKELIEEKFVVKKEFDNTSRGVYALTHKAERLIPIIQSLCRWSAEFGHRVTKETPPECIACGVRTGEIDPFKEDCRPQCQNSEEATTSETGEQPITLHMKRI